MDLRNLPVIETDRLLLRPLSVLDADDMFEYARDIEVARQVAWDAHDSIETTVCHLMTVVEAYSRRELLDWGVTLRENGRVIGSCGFPYWNREHGFAELGYTVGRKHWNMGLGTECARAVLGFGFEQLGLTRVEAQCFVTNAASCRVLEKLGMRFEGVLRNRVRANGESNDVKMYAILGSER